LQGLKVSQDRKSRRNGEIKQNRVYFRERVFGTECKSEYEVNPFGLLIDSVVRGMLMRSKLFKAF
jgi:hypothetical protein